MPQVPDGYFVAFFGATRRGDLLWDYKHSAWQEVNPATECGQFAIARRARKGRVRKSLSGRAGKSLRRPGGGE